MNHFLGTSICWLLRKHRFGKARARTQNEPPTSEATVGYPIKRCIRCGLVREIKQRKRKEGE